MKSLISKSGSFKGYNFKTWLSKNKGTIKALIVAGVTVAMFFLPQISDAQVSAAVAVVSGCLTKLAVDSLDFYVSDVVVLKN